MTSCLGWDEDAFASMRAELDSRARAAGGRSGRFWWSFPQNKHAAAMAVPA